MNIETEKYIDTIVEAIASCQSAGDSFFSEGIFPAYRYNETLFYKRADENIFYTATIVFILNTIKEKVSPQSQQKIAEITKKAIKNYPAFQNKDGLQTYNFWKTKPSQHFSNGYIFKHFDHFRIPDDIDDTALVFLTSLKEKSEVLWLKEKLKQHANLTNRIIQNTFAHYKHLKIYSTWFGKNMPIEFDVCALCNLMYLWETYQLRLNEYDEDTYQLLKEVILREEFLKMPFNVAHNYATTPLIIYHYARLLGRFSKTPIEGCREKMIAESLVLIEQTNNEFEKILLSISLKRLKKDYQANHHFDIETFRKQKSPYFIAGLLSSYENPILQFLAPFSITQMKWHCEAHNLALILENALED